MTSQPEWVAPDACTLPTAEQPLRVAEFDSLFADTLVAVERPGLDTGRLELAGPADTAGRARDLTSRETECCSFFEFEVNGAGGAVTIDVRVPEARSGVLDALLARAAAVREQAR